MGPRFSPPSRLGARVWLHVRDVITILKKSEMRKVCLKRPPKSVKFQEKDEIPLNYATHSAPQISGGLSLIGQSKQ